MCQDSYSLPKYLSALLLVTSVYWMCSNHAVAVVEKSVLELMRHGTVRLTVMRPGNELDTGVGIIVGHGERTTYIVTALHVLVGEIQEDGEGNWEEDLDEIKVRVNFYGDPANHYTGRIFDRWDVDKDLGLVVMNSADLPRSTKIVTFAYGSPSTFPTPYPAYAIAHAQRKDWVVSDLEVVGIHSPFISLSPSAIKPGFSGGPVIAANGNMLVGLVLSVSARGGRGLGTSYILEKLQTWRVPNQLKPARVSTPMLLVPAGTFIMGATQARSDASHERVIYIDDFYMDKYEVTNGQYRRFLAESGYLSASAPSGECGRDKLASDNYPVSCVSWIDAMTYCKWAGKELPTEAEWEKAARGPDGYIYPWGNEQIAQGFAAVGELESSPVGTRPRDTSYYGVMDMLGNVSEWVADWYQSDYYKEMPERNPTGPVSGEDRVLRGGSIRSGLETINLVARMQNLPEYGGNGVEYGFRCIIHPNK